MFDGEIDPGVDCDLVAARIMAFMDSAETQRASSIRTTPTWKSSAVISPGD
jgi:hypothetical protein